MEQLFCMTVDGINSMKMGFPMRKPVQSLPIRFYRSVGMMRQRLPVLQEQLLRIEVLPKRLERVHWQNFYTVRIS